MRPASGAGGGRRAALTVRARTVLEGTAIGDSIAVSGACLTVVELDGGRLRGGLHARDAGADHHRRRGAPGHSVNLERSLAVGGPAGRPSGAGARGRRGRGAGRAAGRASPGEVRISLPEALRGAAWPARAPSPSTASRSRSSAWTSDGFEVGIIPHTLKETTLRRGQGGHAGESGGGRAGPLRAAGAAGAGGARGDERPAARPGGAPRAAGLTRGVTARTGVR